VPLTTQDIGKPSSIAHSKEIGEPSSIAHSKEIGEPSSIAHSRDDDVDAAAKRPATKHP